MVNFVHKMKIGLVLPPSDDILYLDVFGVNLPPTGLAYLAGFLKESGYEVFILDMSSQKMGWSEFDKILSIEKPDIVGIYCALTRIKQAMNAAEIAKQNQAFTVLGGPEPSINDKIFFTNPFVDAVVRGEGEFTFLDLAKHIEGKAGLGTIRGLTYRDKNRVVVNSKRPLIQKLDSLPFPPWHLFPTHKYRLFNKLSLLSIASSRGCVYNCDFCAVPHMYQYIWRGRSPENVVDEIEYLMEKYTPSIVFFSDDSFMVDFERVEEICNEILKRKLEFFWFCLARIDLSINLMNKMKKAGCVALLFNIESHMMNNKDVVEHAFKNAKRAKIFGIANFVFGFPRETYDACLEKIRFITNVNADHAMFFRNVSGGYLNLSTLTAIEKMAYRRFYLRKNYILNHIKQAYHNFKPEINHRGLALHYIKWFFETILYINQLH
ncbi:MAG: B12-binding domain-containing radical SAM protein [Candidatus Bathyarchaeota archaeon]|nr:MAG: B12-binding domain-containing radical SAM protein [Candidatus Bathyarchaeota archaeon]